MRTRSAACGRVRCSARLGVPFARGGPGHGHSAVATRRETIVHCFQFFAWARNPLYIGNFLVWMGFVTISGVLWFLPAAVLLFAVEYELIVRYEEGVLESIFGRDYLDYKNSTPRWIPRPPKGEAPVGDHHWSEAFRSEISTFLQYAVLLIAFWIKSRVAVQAGAIGFIKTF